MKEKINSFWMKKNLALFGLSRNEKSISRQIYRVLIDKGYRIHPINPNADEIDDITCYQKLEQVNHKLEGAIIITNPKVSINIVKQCYQNGINDLWFQLDTMDDEVKAYCDKNGMNYINSCVLLPHKEAGVPHSWHRVF